jgi:hypothetical protein
LLFMFVCYAFAALAASVADATAAIPPATVVAAPRVVVVVVAADLVAVTIGSMPSSCTSTPSIYIDVAPRPDTSVASCQLPRWPSDHRGPPLHACQ